MIPLIQLGQQYIQEIIPNNDTIIRAYINSYYWINNSLYDIEIRNLGYYHDLQTQLLYLFKANIIDYMQHVNFFNMTDADNIFDSKLMSFTKSTLNTTGKVELLILSYLNNYSVVIYIFLQGEIPVNKSTIEKFTNNQLNKTITLKFEYEKNVAIPRKIYSIYNL